MFCLHPTSHDCVNNDYKYMIILLQMVSSFSQLDDTTACLFFNYKYNFLWLMKMKQSKQFKKAKVITRKNHNVIIRIFYNCLHVVWYRTRNQKIQSYPCVYVCVHMFDVVISIFNSIYNRVEVVKPPNISWKSAGLLRHIINMFLKTGIPQKHMSGEIHFCKRIRKI